jgi:DNA-binding PadR family transcriptional regulator
MSKEKNLGEFEILVLAALVRLGDDAYGAIIGREIETATGRAVSIGAIYATLSRLEAKSYVASRVGEATAERGGRAKRHYKVLASGRRQLDRALQMIKKISVGIAPQTEFLAR